PGPVPHGQHLTRLRHRPGVGLVLGIAGLLLFVLSLTADRKSTRLNSSHVKISYAVFCLQNKTHPDAKAQQAVALDGLQADVVRAAGRSALLAAAVLDLDLPQPAAAYSDPLSLHAALPISPGPVPHGQHLTRLRHRPGVGLVLGIAGLLLFVLSLT